MGRHSRPPVLLAFPPQFPIPSTPLPSAGFSPAGKDFPHHRPRHSLVFNSPIPILSSSIHHGRRRRKVLVLVATAFILFCILFLSRNLSVEPPPPLHLPRLRSPLRRPKQVTPVVIQRPKTSYNAFATRKQIELTPPQELAALTQFIASPSSNSLPLDVDPSKALDPQLICDFDTTSDRAPKEVEQLVSDVWTQHPVILFKKQLSPVGREVREMIEEFNLFPPPIIVDVDTREDLPILVPTLKRLTSAPSLPILLIGGDLIAPTIDSLRTIKATGELKYRITKAGAKIDGGKRRKGKKK